MKVLVVVDMQKDFITGDLGTPEARAVAPLVGEKIKELASADTVLIFTKDTHTEYYLNTLEGKNLPVPHCIAGTPGHSIVDEVFAPYCEVMNTYKKLEDIIPLFERNIIEKPSFGSIELQNTLYALDDIERVEEITFMGVCTGICVLSNAILAKATLPEVPVNVIESCCACVKPETHKTAIEAMKLCQINII